MMRSVRTAPQESEHIIFTFIKVSGFTTGQERKCSVLFCPLAEWSDVGIALPSVARGWTPLMRAFYYHLDVMMKMYDVRRKELARNLSYLSNQRRDINTLRMGCWIRPQRPVSKDVTWHESNGELDGLTLVISIIHRIGTGKYLSFRSRWSANCVSRESSSNDDQVQRIF